MEINKLTEDFKAKWVAALRSGDYIQSKGSLYKSNSNGFCCLGVAGILCGVNKENMIDKTYFDSKPTDSDNRMIPPNGYPEILDASKSQIGQQLAIMNDDGKSFSEIADYIETNL